MIYRNVTRRTWLLLASRAALAQQDSAPGREERIKNLIRAFEDQGFHRTGTEVDRLSGLWLMAQVRNSGLTPAREAFALSRVDPTAANITIGEHRMEGLPLFDGGFTDAAGVRGRLGALGSDAPVGVGEIAPNSSGSGALGEARRQNRHRAIVVTTRGGTPGLCPSNADDFLLPFGPPVLQVSGEFAAQLKDGAERGSEALLIAGAKRTQSEAFNVTALIEGSNRTMPPLIVMTPRSGWWTCASERGGGIACWLELMRALRGTGPARDVVFVASSGHEVGYLGIEAFIARRAGIVKQARAWIHFGANVGAAQDPGNTLQASDNEMEALEADAMTKASLRIDRRVPRGSVPGGEAGVVHRAGGRYLSIIGRNALFHNPADHGPEAVDPRAISRFAFAFEQIARALASSAA